MRAAEDVFAEKGYHRSSIEEIAASAEYGTGTVYLYFKDKEALYVELLEQKIRELLDFLQRRTQKRKPGLEALQELVRARMEYFDKNRAFFQIYVREGLNWGRGQQGRAAHVHALYEDYLAFLAKIIRCGQRQGVLRKGNPSHFALALSGMMIELTRRWLETKQDQPLTQQADFVLELFLGGVRQPAKS